MKKIVISIKVLVVTLMTSIMSSVYVLADNDDGLGDVTAPISRFGTLFGGIITAVGMVVLIWSVVNLGLAIKRRDPAATTEAVLGIAGGLIIALAPKVVNYILS